MTICVLHNLPDAYIEISAVGMNSHSIICPMPGFSVRIYRDRGYQSLMTGEAKGCDWVVDVGVKGIVT